VDVDLLARLKSLPQLSGVGSIAWLSRPSKAQLPGMTLQRLAPGRTYTFSGATTLQDTLTRIDFWGLNVRNVKPLFLATLAELERPRTVGSTRFARASLEGERDMPPEDVVEVGTIYRISADFRIWWKPLA